jgi:hypothetical protein
MAIAMTGCLTYPASCLILLLIPAAQLNMISYPYSGGKNTDEFFKPKWRDEP